MKREFEIDKLAKISFNNSEENPHYAVCGDDKAEQAKYLTYEVIS